MITYLSCRKRTVAQKPPYSGCKCDVNHNLKRLFCLLFVILITKRIWLILLIVIHRKLSDWWIIRHESKLHVTFLCVTQIALYFLNAIFVKASPVWFWVSGIDPYCTQQDAPMKLIGSYTSPFVRKISVMLLEKGITFEFVNDSPYAEKNNVARYNPLGKVPALVTDAGECWFDSPIIAAWIELLGKPPVMLPQNPGAALYVRQREALADGVMDAALVSVREQQRPAAQQSETELARQREKILQGLDALESAAARGEFDAQHPDIATIAVGCAVGYLNFRRVAPGWCVDRPHLVKLVGQLFLRDSFVRTEPPAV